MGVSLSSLSGNDFDFSTSAWSFVLNLAIQYGWKQMGTIPPENWRKARENEGKEAWSGDYETQCTWKPGDAFSPEDSVVEEKQEEAWSGEYEMFGGQVVQAADAQALADAIARAIADPALRLKVAKLRTNFRRMVRSFIGNKNTDLAEAFGPGFDDPQEYRNLLTQFTDFCRAGEFRIDLC